MELKYRKQQWARADCHCCRRPQTAWVMPGAVHPQGQAKGARVRCADCRVRCKPMACLVVPS